MIKNHYVDDPYPVHRRFSFFSGEHSNANPQALAAKKFPVIFIFIRALDNR